MMSDRLKISEGLGFAIQNLPLNSLSLERDVSVLQKPSNREFILILLSSLITLPGTDTRTPLQAVWATSLFRE